MESVARKYSRQMDGLEYLVHTGPPPQCLLGTPDATDQEENSVDSSLLSEPFSEYAPLEDFPETGLEGQLTKFSNQFQATMHEIRTSLKTEELDNATSSIPIKNERINWEKVLGGVKLELDIPPGLVHTETDDSDDEVQTKDESGMWCMIEQYTDFTLNLNESGAALGRTQHWLDQAQAHHGTREMALGKCASWLEKNVPVPQSRSRSEQDSSVLLDLAEKLPRAQTAKTHKDHEKSMWNRAILAFPK